MPVASACKERKCKFDRYFKSKSIKQIYMTSILQDCVMETILLKNFINCQCLE